MNTEQTFLGFTRGTDDKPGFLPNNGFYSPRDIRTEPFFEYRPHKLFLGLIDAQLEPGLDYFSGHECIYATGGKPIGVADDRHILTVAGSRSGKGVSAIVPNLLSYQGSILAIDPKAELASMTAKFRKETLKQNVFVLDPFNKATNCAAEWRAEYNPLDILSLEDSSSFVEDAGLIADAIIIPDEHGDSHWDETAKNILEGLIIHVATHTSYHGRRNLKTVYQLAMNIMRDSSIRKTMEKNRIFSDVVKEAASTFFEKEEKERNGVLSTLRRHVRFLGYSSISSVLGKSSFDLDKIKSEPTTIYLCLPAMRLGTCSRWFRLFVNLVLSRMEETAKKPKVPVLLCLDEFAALGHMKSIEDAAGQIAGFGCRLWPILQDLGQLETLYKDRWQTFMANAGVLQFFGNSDMKTLEWISNRLGETTVRESSQKDLTLTSREQSDESGLTFTTKQHSLLTPEEISRYFSRDDPMQRQLVFVAGKSPIVLQRVCYYRDHRFKDYAENTD